MRRLAEADNIPEGDRRLLAEVKRIVTGMLPDAQVLLYGSAARGERGPESDYDVLVLSGSELSDAEERRVRDAVFDLGLEGGAVISLAFYSKEEWDSPLWRVAPYRRNIEAEGVVL